jgi:hypothetical protein
VLGLVKLDSKELNLNVILIRTHGFGYNPENLAVLEPTIRDYSELGIPANTECARVRKREQSPAEFVTESGQETKMGGSLTCLTLVPGAVERRRDSPDHRLRVRLVHRPGRRGHRVDLERARGGAAAVYAGGSKGAEQEELPAEGRRSSPHVPAVLQMVPPRVGARAH